MVWFEWHTDELLCVELVAIIAIGYADTQKASLDRHSLERKAVDEFVFYETF